MIVSTAETILVHPAARRAQAWTQLAAAHEQLRAAGRDIRAAHTRLDAAREYT